MKKVTVVAVGKIKEKFFADAINEYSKRLSRFCKLNLIELNDYETDSVNKESAHIISKCPRIDFLLDIEGELLSSPQLSAKMDGAYLNSDNITFVIGGSNGVSDEVKARAQRRLSFGRITYPHQLMRVILFEQIYRAFAISEGLPYHK